MILDSPTRVLQVILAGAVATTQPQVSVWYRDYNPQGEPTKPALTFTATNGANDVTVLAAPQAGNVREIMGIDIHNRDTASVTITIKVDDGGTESIFHKATITAGSNLHWSINAGWQ